MGSLERLVQERVDVVQVEVYGARSKKVKGRDLFRQVPMRRRELCQVLVKAMLCQKEIVMLLAPKSTASPKLGLGYAKGFVAPNQHSNDAPNRSRMLQAVLH